MRLSTDTYVIDRDMLGMLSPVAFSGGIHVSNTHNCNCQKCSFIVMIEKILALSSPFAICSCTFSISPDLQHQADTQIEELQFWLVLDVLIFLPLKIALQNCLTMLTSKKPFAQHDIMIAVDLCSKAESKYQVLLHAIL